MLTQILMVKPGEVLVHLSGNRPSRDKAITELRRVLAVDGTAPGANMDVMGRTVMFRICQRPDSYDIRQKIIGMTGKVMIDESMTGPWREAAMTAVQQSRMELIE